METKAKFKPRRQMTCWLFMYLQELLTNKHGYETPTTRVDDRKKKD